AAVSDTGKFRLDHELGLDPDEILAPLVRRQFQRPLVDAQGRKALEQVVRHFLGVAGADPAGITKLAVLIHRDDERADRARHRGRRHVACDDEFLLAAALGLYEIIGAARAIRRAAPLGDDALEPHFAGVPENDRTGLVEVARVAHDVALDVVLGPAFEKFGERGLTFDQRLAGEIAAVEIQQIEHIIDEAVGATVFQIGLQQRKTTDAAFVLDDDFAVEQGSLGRQRGDRFGNRREAVRPILLLARQQLHIAGIEPRLDPIAVELDLMQPIRPARSAVVERSERDRNETRRRLIFGGARRFGFFVWFALCVRLRAGLRWARRRFCSGARACLGAGSDLPDFLFEARLVLRLFLSVAAVGAIGVPHALFALAAGDLFDAAPADDRARLLFQNVTVARSARFFVLALDQEPVVVAVALACAHAYEMPAAMQFFTVEIEDEMAFGERLVRIAFRRPGAAGPDHHRAAPLFALPGGALEGVVLDRMILDLHRKPLLVGIKARAAGDRPALHHAVEFQPQVIMQPSCGVLLNDVAVTAARALAAARLRCHIELSLLPVSFQRHRDSNFCFSVVFPPHGANFY